MNRFIWCFIILFVFNQLNGQTDYDKVPSVTETILINDIYIFPNAIDSFGLGDILIEGSLIKKIAPQIDAPYNAKIIEGDSAYVYPAFIDALSHAGIPKPDSRQERPKVDFKGFPPDDVAGIQPGSLAIETFKHDDNSLSKMRKSGFGIAHVVPRGNMLPGQGSLMILNGGKTEQMILSKSTGQFFQLEGARGVYPNTVIAVMAKWRELYKNAEIHMLNLKNYKLSPVNMDRPSSNLNLESLIPVIEKNKAVFALANSSKDVHRMIALQQELGYNMVLCDVQRVEPALKKMKTDNIKILLSLDLPKEEKEKKKEKDEKEEDASTKELIQRKNESIKTYLSQAALLEKENIPFAFSLINADPSDLKDNLNRLIENGLSKNYAMQALTTNAAKILGIDNVVGSIAEGKMANLFISTTNYLDKESNIKYSIVEGNIEEYEISKKTKNPTGEDGEALIGTWSYSTDVMGDISTGIIEITKEGENLKIIIIDDDNKDEKDECYDIVYEKNKLSMSVDIEVEVTSLTIGLVLEMSKDKYEGTVTIPDIGSFPIEGSKLSNPE